MITLTLCRVVVRVMLWITTPAMVLLAAAYEIPDYDLEVEKHFYNEAEAWRR